MSSVNRRLVMVLPPMLTFPSCSSRASDIILFRKNLKRVGEKKHPCLTPIVVLNHSPVLPFICTALIAFSYRCSVARTRFALILYFRMVAHKAACHTLSNAFFEIYEDMLQILLILKVLFTQDSEVENLFCGTPPGSELSLFFSNNLFSLGFEPVQDDSLHHFTWMTDEAYGSVILAEL